jgi:LCP family protein required for cell wall assembly
VQILGGALLFAAVITAVLVFQFVTEMIHTTTIVELPGLEILPTRTGDSPDAPVVPQQPDSDVPGLELPTWDGASRVNILVMGLDAADWYSVERSGPPKTDSMILFTYDPATETAAMLSIPRDLWVNIPGFEQNKINQAYALGEGARVPGGGPGMATRTVEELLGVDIHYYAQIDFHAFVDFVDFIGGVCVFVEQPMELEIPGKFIDVKLEPGQRCMKGDHMLAYIRNRYVKDGDIDRSRRQQQAIIAIRDKIILNSEAQRLILGDPLGLWNIFSSGVQTNIPFDAAFSLGLDALKLNLDQIGRYVIAPPDYVQYATSPDGSQEILKPMTANIRKLRDEIFTFGATAGPAATGDPLTLMKAEEATVGVFNGSSVTGLAAATQDYLTTLEVDVIEIGNTTNYVNLTTIYDFTGNPYTVQYLVDLMRINKTRIFNRYDPASAIDVRIELGDDWHVPGQ